MKFHAFCQCREWRSIRRRFRGQISPFFANARRVRIHRKKSLRDSSLSVACVTIETRFDTRIYVFGVKYIFQFTLLNVTLQFDTILTL